MKQKLYITETNNKSKSILDKKLKEIIDLKLENKHLKDNYAKLLELYSLIVTLKDNYKDIYLRGDLEEQINYTLEYLNDDEYFNQTNKETDFNSLD